MENFYLMLSGLVGIMFIASLIFFIIMTIRNVMQKECRALYESPLLWSISLAATFYALFQLLFVSLSEIDRISLFLILPVLEIMSYVFIAVPVLVFVAALISAMLQKPFLKSNIKQKWVLPFLFLAIFLMFFNGSNFKKFEAIRLTYAIREAEAFAAEQKTLGINYYTYLEKLNKEFKNLDTDYIIDFEYDELEVIDKNNPTAYSLSTNKIISETTGIVFGNNKLNKEVHEIVVISPGDGSLKAGLETYIIIAMLTKSADTKFDTPRAVSIINQLIENIESEENSIISNKIKYSLRKDDYLGIIFTIVPV